MISRLFGFFHLFNIRTKMIVVMLLIIITPVSVIFLIVNRDYSAHILENSVYKLNVNDEKIASTFNAYAEDIKSLNTSIATSETLQQSLNDKPVGYDTKSKVESFLRNVKRSDIASVIYMDNQDNIYNTDIYEQVDAKKVLNSHIYKELQPTSGEMVWWYGSDDLSDNQDKSYIFAARKVNHLDYLKKPGMLIFKIKPENVIEFMPKPDQSGIYLVVNETGGIVIRLAETKGLSNLIDVSTEMEAVRSQAKGIYINNLDGTKVVVTYRGLQQFGWYVFGIAPYSEILAPVKSAQQHILWVTLFSTLGAIGIALLFAYSFTSPIKNIVNKMRLVKNGKLDVSVQLNRQDEIGELSETFNRMTSEIRSLLSEVKLQQERSRSAELNALIHQINPHFLYNTLDNISMLAQNSNEPRIHLLITSLSRLLRIGLSKGEQTIPIRDEIEHVRHYLIIQKIRHGDLFSYEIEIEDESLLDQQIIKLLLQPLVENAILHGFRQIRSGGWILIRLFREHHQIVLEVSDNGKSISEEGIGKVKEEISLEKETIVGKGYGLNNVHSRIGLMYGDRYGLQIEINAIGGVTCRIAIPA